MQRFRRISGNVMAATASEMGECCWPRSADTQPEHFQWKYFKFTRSARLSLLVRQFMHLNYSKRARRRHPVQPESTKTKPANSGSEHIDLGHAEWIA